MTLIQVKRGLAASWTAANPILAQGEFGFEIDTHKLKVGTGLAHWNDLDYLPLTPADLGLDQVDNTADLDKPISTATQTALDDKSDVGHGHTQTDILDLTDDLAGKEPTITVGTTSDYWRGDKSWVTLDKTAVGLGQVDNTSDLDKPVSNDTQTALDDKSDVGHGHATSDITGLDATLSGIASDISGLDTAVGGKEPSISSGTTSQYWRGDKSFQTLDKSAVGLGDVDNTADTAKPISTATQTALDGKEPSVSSGTTAQYYRGDKSWQTLDAAAVSGAEDTANKGQPGGYASLDGGGKVPVSQLPNSIMEYQGLWDASTNTPTLDNGTGDPGNVYRVSVAGTTSLGAGMISFAVGDYVIYSPATSAWEKADTTDAVSSVNGYTGAVSLAKSDVGLGNVDDTSDATKNAAAVTLTNKTLTSPKVNEILDASGAVAVSFSTTTGGNNYLQICNAQDQWVGLQAWGASAAVPIYLYPKGTGTITIYAPTGTPGLAAEGATNQDFNIAAKGTGQVTANGVPVVTTTGTQSLSNKTLSNPTIEGYTEGVSVLGTVGSSATLDISADSVITATLTASTACTFTMPTAVAGKSFTLMLKQPAATGNGTATFTGVKWGTAGAPTITAAAGKMDILSFFSDGTNWYGSAAQGYTY